MERLIDLDSRQVRSVLHILLKDRTTGHNIIWATDTYAPNGEEYSAKKTISAALVTGENSNIIQLRIAKTAGDQADRTKKRAEVFTPAWICNLMNNHCDEVYASIEYSIGFADDRTAILHGVNKKQRGVAPISCNIAPAKACIKAQAACRSPETIRQLSKMLQQDCAETAFLF